MTHLGVTRDKRDLPAAEILRQPTSSLVGVTDDVATALQNMRISTVFDLAMANAFGDASRLVVIADPATIEAALAMLPAETLDDDASAAIADVPSLAASALTGLDDATAGVLADVGVSTIDDAAHWPPYVTARSILDEMLGGGDVLDTEERDSERLRPRIGEYPTERVYYESLVMLDPGSSDDLEPLEDIGQVPLDRLFQPPDAAQKVAVGAILTFSQSWFVQGVTLGSLLHSLALAPGEATRVAVVDWKRSSSGSTDASVSATDAMDASSGRGRALSEVTSAVANETQSGFSGSSSQSALSSETETTGHTDNAFLGGIFGGDTGSGGSSETNTNMASSAQSTSWSTGSRDITAELTQNVAESTEQQATSVRNRRASTVQEVSDSESEQISTRIVANYNHMHALTVEYWEVVQTYRVQVDLQRYTRALFVPMESLDFDDDAAIDQLRFVLARVALTRRARELLLGRPAVTELKPTLPTMAVDPGHFEVGPVAAVIDFKDKTQQERPSDIPHKAGGEVLGQTGRDLGEELPIAAQRRADTAYTGTPVATGMSQRAALMRSAPLAPVEGSVAHVNMTSAKMVLGVEQAFQPGETRGVWNLPAIDRTAAFFNHPILSANGTSLEAPTSAILEAIDLDGFGAESLEIVTTEDAFTLHAKGTSLFRLETAIPLSTVQRISIKRGETRKSGTVTLRMRQDSAVVAYPFPASISAGEANATVITAKNAAVPEFAEELKTHLKFNRLHYNRAAYESLDPSQISALLAGFSFEGKPLLAGVEPRPFTIAGNYLVLRAPTDEDEAVDGQDTRDRTAWGQLVDEFRLGDVGQNPPRLISLPSGGVFAEAVLGRSNSAEKLDITRFWDWQESPIPLTPPEIAPVASGQREGSTAPGTDHLDAPIIAQSSPLAIPDPGASNALLSAISASSIFRDMSGLAGTQGLAQAAGQGVVSAGGAGLQAALGAQQTEAQRSIAMQQIGADMFKSLVGAGMAAAGAAVGGPAGAALGQAGGQLLGGGQKGTGSSIAGAKINQGKDMDARGVPGPSSGRGDSGGSTASGGSGGSTPTDGRGSPVSSGGSGSTQSGLDGLPGGNERSAYQSTLPAYDSDVGRTLADTGGKSKEDDTTGQGPAGQTIPASVERRLRNAREAVPTSPGFNIVESDEAGQLLTGRVIIANFDVNSAVLKPEALPAIAQLAAVLDAPDAMAYIEGRASQTGPEEFNQVLSNERAEAGYEGLLRYNVDPKKIIEVVGLGSTEPLVDRRGFEEPLNRSILIAYQVPLTRPIKTEPPEPAPAPAGTTDWSVRVNFSASFGRKGIGGAVAIVQLKRRDSEEVKQGKFAGGGIGVGLQLPASPQWGDWADFQTDTRVTFEDFDGILSRLTMAGASVALFGFSWAYLSFPMLGANSISVGGGNMGAIGADANTNVGIFTLD